MILYARVLKKSRAGTKNVPDFNCPENETSFVVEYDHRVRQWCLKAL